AGLGALAVCRGIEAMCGLQAEIKWPNDVLLDRKKVCGVLAEAHWLGDQLQAIVLGIGVNVRPEAVPPEDGLNFTATSVDQNCGRTIERLPLMREILLTVLKWWPLVWRASFLEVWEERLAYRGEAVVLLAGSEQHHQGRLKGLDSRGRLVLVADDGEEAAFQAGEIHLRPLVDRGAK
ncbi:biotin--[acetyl-CoA-carboxylase] ligase, partial [Chloroflexota bacterium]